MSFSEVLAELPSLTVDQRQMLVRRALELDDPEITAEDEVIVEQRMAAHRHDPKSTVSLADMEERVRARLRK
jgi:hypothetical protein